MQNRKEDIDFDNFNHSTDGSDTFVNELLSIPHKKDGDKIIKSSTFQNKIDYKKNPYEICQVYRPDSEIDISFNKIAQSLYESEKTISQLDYWEKPSNNYSYDDPSAFMKLNDVVEDIVSKNMPKVFKNTTIDHKDEITNETIRTQILSGFYRTALINDINTLREDWSNWSDDETEIKVKDDSDNTFNPSTDILGLPSTDKLSQLNNLERRYISKIYNVLQGSQLTYNNCLKYWIPPQNVELGVPKPRERSTGELISSNAKDKLEQFKPPRYFEFSGNEYYFNAFTGRYFSYMNYRCRDYKRCKGSIKLSTIDPLRNIEILKGHSDQCRSNSEDWSFSNQVNMYEKQERFNLLI